METLLVILHRRNFGSAARFRNRLRYRGDELLAEIKTSLDVIRGAARDDVARQAAVVDRVEWWMWRAMSGNRGTEERIARHSCGRHRRHCQRRQRNERGCRCSGNDLAVRQRPRA